MSDNKEKEEEKPVVAKTAVDLQRLKLMKLMKNPEKPVILPERPKAKNTPTVPEFVRNVMGSSAGAGSGEFHVYRHLRRKEYARQKFIQEKGRKELLDDEYHLKLEENRRLAEETTAKKRAKRLKKKQKWKQKKRIKNAGGGQKGNKNDGNSSEEEDSQDSESDTDNDDASKAVPDDPVKANGSTESSASDTTDNKDVNSHKENVQEPEGTPEEDSRMPKNNGEGETTDDNKGESKETTQTEPSEPVNEEESKEQENESTT